MNTILECDEMVIVHCQISWSDTAGFILTNFDLTK